jgi:hypothetical protein
VNPALVLEGASVVAGAVRELSFNEWVEQWHEFYLMAGTAAVTLAGLLFVALSLHLDRLVEESHEHLLALARVTLLSYTFVLMTSMFMLVPAHSKRQTAILLGIMAVAGLVFTFRLTRAARHHDEAGFSRGLIRKRLMFPSVAYVLILLTAVGVGLGVPEVLYMLVGATCMILGNAAGTSWDLLVRIAKHRRAGARG